MIPLLSHVGVCNLRDVRQQSQKKLWGVILYGYHHNDLLWTLQTGAASHLGVVTKDLISVLASNTRQLVAAKGDSRVKDIIAIHPDGAGLDTTGQAVHPVEVLGPDASSKTILIAV